MYSDGTPASVVSTRVDMRSAHRDVPGRGSVAVGSAIELFSAVVGALVLLGSVEQCADSIELTGSRARSCGPARPAAGSSRPSCRRPHPGTPSPRRMPLPWWLKTTRLQLGVPSLSTAPHHLLNRLMHPIARTSSTAASGSAGKKRRRIAPNTDPTNRPGATRCSMPRRRRRRAPSLRA